jgi:hypothetical protein
MQVPLNRQSQRFKCEGIDLSISTLADQVGAASFALTPLYRLIETHALSAERLHGDETTVPILAKGKTVTGRIWTYVRDDRPFGSQTPPAAVYYASRDRRGEHPQRIYGTSPASCRPTRITASTLCLKRRASRRQLRLPFAGRIAEGCSSNSPTSPKTPGAAGTPRRSHRSR